MRQELWREVEPRKYKYTISASGLVQSMLLAMFCRLPGLRAIADKCSHLLGTTQFSSIAPALKRRSSAEFVRRMAERLQQSFRTVGEPLVALDGMAVTLRKTLRHHCPKYNHRTVGGGVVWGFIVEAAKGVCPIKIFAVAKGAWSDGKLIRDVELDANGPVYLCDRGFYGLELLEQWLAQRVRFVVRAKKSKLVYQIVRESNHPHRHGNCRIKFDAIVRLGGSKAKAYPVVRMIFAILPSGDDLILVTDRKGWSTARILDSYRKRWHIERYHRFIKQTLGLAHLYSFDWNGVQFLIYTTFLLATLIFMSDYDSAAQTIERLKRAHRFLRKLLGLETIWKPNTSMPWKPKRKRAAQLP